MENEPRFFVSFSSKDLTYVSEIMAALKGQGLYFWDYSNIIESIEVGGVIQERLANEIDSCSHMIVVISENSTDKEIGRFCRFELEYALNRKSKDRPILIPVVIGKPGEQKKFEPPYDIFSSTLYHELDGTPESIVKFTIKVCKIIDKLYLPPIEAHPNLPFWQFFRKEVEEIAHSNKEHVDLMMTLGEFNEYFIQGNMQRAQFLINYFILTCEYKLPSYHPFYPWIVKAVCETELKNFDAAMNSYEEAKKIQPENQDAKGGMGTVYFQTGQFVKAAECFEYIIRNNKSEDVNNARINLIITKQVMASPISHEEEKFLFNVDINHYANDLKTAILHAQAVQYKIKKNYEALEKHCRFIMSKNLHDTITIRLLQGSFISRNMDYAAREVISQAIEEAKINTRLNIELLKSFN